MDSVPATVRIFGIRKFQTSSIAKIFLYKPNNPPSVNKIKQGPWNNSFRKIGRNKLAGKCMCMCIYNVFISHKKRYKCLSIVYQTIRSSSSGKGSESLVASKNEFVNTSCICGVSKVFLAFFHFLTLSANI